MNDLNFMSIQQAEPILKTDLGMVPQKTVSKHFKPRLFISWEL